MYLGQDRAANVWGVELEPSRRDELRFPEIAAFAALIFDGVAVPGLSFPVSTAAAMVFIGIVLFRRADLDLRVPVWFLGLLGGLVVWYVVTSQLNGVDATRRLGNITILVALAATIASGRVHVRSAGIGLGLGVLLAVPHAILTLPASSYVGRLTGMIGDPNGAGLILAALGACAVGLLERTSHRVVVGLILLLGIGLTFSRTTYLAAAVGIAWVAVGKRVSVPLAVPLLTGIVLAIQRIPDSLIESDFFGEREGSDALRERIVEAEAALVARSPWTGNGAGTAVVEVGDRTFFFHSSYLAMRADGGWVALGALIAAVTLTFLAVASVPLDKRNGWLEGAILAALICALNIGEALLTASLMVPLGLAMRHALVNGSSLLRSEDDPTPYDAIVAARAP